MNSTSFKKILILVTILAVPGFLYYLLQEKGKNRYRPLPVFGPKTVAPTFHHVRGVRIPDTIYHTLRDFNLTNQLNTPVSLKNLEGKIILFGLFRAGAGDGRPDHVSRAMQKYAAMYAQNDLLHFISITVNPSEEPPALLKPYAERLSASKGKWDLLTGDSATVYNLIRKDLFLDALQVAGNEPKTFTYSNLLVLTDSHHRIRGYYEVVNDEALSKLDDEIKVLIVEELRNKNDGR